MSGYFETDFTVLPPAGLIDSRGHGLGEFRVVDDYARTEGSGLSPVPPDILAGVGYRVVNHEAVVDSGDTA